MLADQERQFLHSDQRKCRRQRLNESLGRAHSVATAKPFAARRVVSEPGVWTRQNQLPSRFHQIRERIEKPPRCRQAVHEIRTEHDIERAESRAQIARIPHFKPDAIRVHTGGYARLQFGTAVTLIHSQVSETTTAPQRLGRLDKTPREVYSDNFDAHPRQLEAGTPNSAAHIQCARLRRKSGHVEAFGHTAHRVIQPGARSKIPRQHLFGSSVMKEQILIQQLLCFIRIHGIQYRETERCCPSQSSRDF